MRHRQPRGRQHLSRPRRASGDAQPGSRVGHASPWVTLIVSNDVNLLSKRVGNYQWSPSMGMLIDQLWVR